jgi:hypothetical protein
MRAFVLCALGVSLLFGITHAAAQTVDIEEKVAAILDLRAAGAIVGQKVGDKTYLSRVSLSGLKNAGRLLQYVAVLRELEEVELAGTDITDQDLKQLTDVPNLKLLNLASTQISDKGLAQLKGMKTLKTLSLVGTKVTDDGMAHLYDLKGLQTLILNDTKVTETGVNKLHVLVPDVKVIGVKAQQAQGKKSPLSLSVTLNKKQYQPSDRIVLSFQLKNESDQALFVGDGWLGPKYTETGPERHFELHVTADGKAPLYFWSGMMTEGVTSGLRKVIHLKPGETYTGSICLSAGSDKDRDYAKNPHEERGGIFEDKSTHKKHVLGAHGKKYQVQLLYQVRDSTHGVHLPPENFKKELLWNGQLWSNTVEFEMAPTQ